MGEVIRKDAAAEAIAADVVATVTNAQERGGAMKETAERRLGVHAALLPALAQNLAAATKAYAALKAALGVADQRADDCVASVYDAAYNLLGRPGNDPMLQVVFPGGISGIAAGDQEGQPERMELCADLLEKGIHKGIPVEKAKPWVADLRAHAKALEAAAEAARKPRTRRDMAERTYILVARSGQVELGRLKRAWQSEGMSEADIHLVIPDRPASRP